MSLTKRGDHGTLHRYAIEYTDADDGGCPTFTWKCWAYDSEHAVERFLSGPDSEGWRLHRIARITDQPRHRWGWRNL